jgi:hypothetical protein
MSNEQSMWIGSGPYVVIDNRNKEISKSQDDQSDEGDSDPDEVQEPGNSDSPKENDTTKRLKMTIRSLVL